MAGSAAESRAQVLVDETGPADAYRILAADPSAQLVDVRTQAEWAYVGMPDLGALGRPVLRAEWARFPDMARNPDFLAQLAAQMGGRLGGRLLFICRSGVRSLAAAQAVAATCAAAGVAVHCTNVAEGFEGDLDASGHRGRVNGWKMRDLPWRQN